MCRSLSLSTLALSLLLPRLAFATYSIAAASPATGEVGGAGTSCVGSYSVSVIYASAPGAGVVLAQAQANLVGRDRAAIRLGAGVAPADILIELTDPRFDPSASTRQYGVVDRFGRAAGFTGADTLPFAGDLQGTAGELTYSVQGNILTSRRVLEQAEAAFRIDGCDLADRLMRALEGGAENGEGDSRCTPAGIPSDGAFIQVDRPGEPSGRHLSLRVDDTAPENPLVRLRAQFDLWRLEHPCPSQAGDAGLPDLLLSDGGPQPDALGAGVPSAGDASTEDAALASADTGQDGTSCSVAHARIGEGSRAGIMGLLALLLARRPRGAVARNRHVALLRAG